MNDDISVLLFKILIVVILGFVIFCEGKKIIYNRKMFKRIKESEDGNFEYIYNKIIRDPEFDLVRSENRKNVVKRIIFVICTVLMFVVAVIIPSIKQVEINSEYNAFSVGGVAIFCIGYFITRTKVSNYKSFVIQKIMLAINPSAKYKGINNECFGKIYCYDFDGSYANRQYVTDYIEYTNIFDDEIKIADVHLKNKESGRKSKTHDVFEGIVARIDRKNRVSANILIEKNKLLKRKNRISSEDEFERYFDIYSEDDNSANLIINSEVKNELLSLYKKYGIMFEIALKENSLYIRFFTGGIFENKIVPFRTIDKKRLYRDYLMFNSVLAMINRINELI